MKIIIAGSRTIDNYNILLQVISMAVAQKVITTTDIEIVSGGATGVDTLAKRFAQEYGFSYKEFKPQYLYNGDVGAPLRRNKDMGVYGDILIAIWDGVSTGTKHMISVMQPKPCHIYKITTTIEYQTSLY